MSTKEYLACVKMFTTVDNQFSYWLEEKMKEREWSQSELARRAGLTRGAINNILTAHRQPGPEFCRAIARALDLPEELVFREAGLLSPKNEEPPTLSEWIHIFWEADEKERDRMIEVAKTLLRESKK